MIYAENLTREFGRFKKKVAVDKINLDIPAGGVFGFLGHNGAGKTTTVRMLTGQLQPSSGVGTIAGFDIVHARPKIYPIIGVVFDHQNLYEKKSGRDNLTLFADLYNVPHSRADELLEVVGLQHRAKEKVKGYSNGMKQRILIARALLHGPKVLFLDEPSRGLDPNSAREIRDVIKKLALEGTTVFLTTHYMKEADELCDQVAFIAEGQIIESDTPQNLKLKYGTRQAQVVLADHSSHQISLESPAGAAQLEKWLATSQVQTIHSQEATLEDVFIQLAGKGEE